MEKNRTDTIQCDIILVVQGAGAHAGEYVAEQGDVVLEVSGYRRRVKYGCGGAGNTMTLMIWGLKDACPSAGNIALITIATALLTMK